MGAHLPASSHRADLPAVAATSRVPRDALRCRADYRSRYERLKRDLAHAHGADLMAYARDKDDFVNEVLGARDKTQAPTGSYPRRP
ncbi:GrpB family protein [Micromonospora echinospora]|uniref:GrpB family protein n=1 Tax=Micromonospora echinospora TaxID=1877 RepID=UPI00366A7927